MTGWTTIIQAERIREERCAECGHRAASHGVRGCWVRVNGRPSHLCGCRGYTQPNHPQPAQGSVS